MILFVLAGCDTVDNNNEESEHPRAISNEIIHVPLFEIRKHNPVMVPDGYHVTLAEFNSVEGMASVDGPAEIVATPLGMRPLSASVVRVGRRV